jgi:pimeloyl-ACP methyl ester carboxylesterase
VEQRRVAVGGVELALAESGRGGRPLLLLHGFTGAKEDFGDWMAPLADAGWHVVAPDHRGHGASDHPADEAAYSFEIFAADSLGLADALGWDRFALLGHSMGGMVAQLMAIGSPERLDHLVLMDTAPGPLGGMDPDLVEALLTVVRTQGVDALADLMAGQSSPLETPAHRRLMAERPGYAEFGERKLRGTAAAVYAAMAPRFTAGPDRLEQLTALPASLPTLVMVGALDRPFLTPSQQMASAIPSATLAVIPDAGHSPQFENPEAWWAALSGFLNP